MNHTERRTLSLLASKLDELAPIGTGLVDLLSDVKGARKAAIVAVTEPKMRKTANPYYGSVEKINHCLVDLNLNYENKVNKALVKAGEEPNFEAGGNWHEPILRPDGTLTPFCRHKSTHEVYLRAVLDKVLSTEYIDKVTGSPISESVLAPWLIKSEPSHGVRFFTTKLSNVRGVTYGGKTYMLA
jgi:hypothetical protein